ncbi:putative zinc-binding metallopeptidase [Pseudorhodoferax sp. Leaf267]|uniref:zinc-binding metallopeptidase family protein n=1 Tax=Pseudorhodoferax sp. Leaf267 TaxID=1736316 RepID=UPI0009E89C57|nr:putative zinc-binding peptidase [Pseudorhodoferax sp. Leaf267]
MQIFSCDQCGHPVFFENVQCLHCGSSLAFVPERVAVTAIEPVPPGEAQALAEGGGSGDPPPALWQARGTPTDGQAQRYRMCQTHALHQACNFTVSADDPNPLCISCRQTSILPDLSIAANRPRWIRIETAKRRLLYTLLRLGLADAHGSEGPVYQFLADLPGEPPVMTGHANGIITLNVAEADDDERMRRRVQLFEPYRTLLGHLRHESGHYYWDHLVRDEPQRLAAFRQLFGDETVDYMQSLQAHYAAGDQRADWKPNFVSAYAAAHPWEDWAETWAHYLHMVDLLETAASYRTRIVLPSADGAQPSRPADPFGDKHSSFDEWIAQWVPVTLLLNSLNRSLGQEDAYPFALSERALHKLRFVHEMIAAHAARAKADPAPANDGEAQPVQVAAAPAYSTGVDTATQEPA